LARCVPHLQFEFFVVDVHNFHFEVNSLRVLLENTYCRNMVQSMLVLNKSH
jgi:hypothetical protein